MAKQRKLSQKELDDQAYLNLANQEEPLTPEQVRALFATDINEEPSPTPEPELEEPNYGEQIARQDTLDDHLIDHIVWLEFQIGDITQDIRDMSEKDTSSFSGEQLLKTKIKTQEMFDHVLAMKKEATAAFAEVNVDSLVGVGFDQYQKISHEFEAVYEQFYKEWFVLRQDINEKLQPFMQQYEAEKEALSAMEPTENAPTEEVMANTDKIITNTAEGLTIDAVQTGVALANPLNVMFEAARGGDSIDSAAKAVQGAYNDAMDEAITIAKSEEENKKNLEELDSKPNNIQTKAERNEIRESSLSNNKSAREMSNVAMFFHDFSVAIKKDFQQTKIGTFLVERKAMREERAQAKPHVISVRSALESLQEDVAVSNYFSQRIEKLKKIRDIEITRNIKPIERAFERARHEATLGTRIQAVDKHGKEIKSPVYDGKAIAFPYKTATEWMFSEEGKAYLDENATKQTEKSRAAVEGALFAYSEKVKSPNAYLYNIKEMSAERVASAMEQMDKAKDFGLFYDIDIAARELRLPGYTNSVSPEVDKAVTAYIQERNEFELQREGLDTVELKKAENKLEKSLNDKMDNLGNDFANTLSSRLRTLHLTVERERLEKVKNERGVAEQKKTRIKETKEVEEKTETTPVR